MDIVDKAKKRIKRQIKTGEPQHRVRKVSDKVYQYVVTHHDKILVFRADSLGRLKEVKQ